MDVLLKYLKRCNMMLQQGQYVADVAYFISEDAPKMTGVTNPELPQGYSFDYINGDIIKGALTVKDGKLTLPNGIAYSILVMPQLKTIRPELLAKIKELVQQGAVILGPKPERSPSLQGYPDADKSVQNIADDLWGKNDGLTVKINHYGKGLVLSGMSMQEALDLIKVIPDLRIAKSDSILFIHRQLQEGSVYFISNQKNSPVKISATFRITGKKPELWNAVTGSTRALPAYHQTASTTTTPIQLAPYESAFVIFSREGNSGDTTKTNYPAPAKTIFINKPWMVSFDKNMRGPIKPVKFDTLSDWSKNANDSIRYYSGTAWYQNSFKIKNIEKGANYVIDLGLARAIAKISVNGVEMGGAWTPPYQLDITRSLKPGENKLEIKIVNTWVNRLLGDALLPADQRKTATLFGPDPRNGLQSSGLLGPVTIKVYKY